MKYSVLKTIIFLFIFVILAQTVDRYFFDHKVASITPNLIKKPASIIFAKLENARFFSNSLIRIRNLISENDSLKRKNLSLLSQLADYEDIKIENSFLRKAFKVAPRFKGEIIYASIFNSQLNLDGYSILLTKGANDGIGSNDVVITEEGSLLGRIDKVYDNFASLLVVTDQNFSVTARVLGSDTAGIAKGAMEKGLYFDLIVQNDLIKEGDIIISSGIDFFPPALIIGTVTHVDTNETDLFKKVKIRPVIDDVKMGRVLIIKNSH